MKNNRCFTYVRPDTEVFVVRVEIPMLQASISNSSSESFDGNDDNFESIWG